MAPNGLALTDCHWTMPSSSLSYSQSSICFSAWLLLYEAQAHIAGQQQAANGARNNEFKVFHGHHS